MEENANSKKSDPDSGLPVRSGFHSVAAEQEAEPFVSLKMEDDKKKKKKNKKKKNKQAETTDNVPISGNDQVSKDAADDGRLDDVPVTGNGQVPEAVADVRSDAMQDADANGNRHESNGTECVSLILINFVISINLFMFISKHSNLNWIDQQLIVKRDVHCVVCIFVVIFKDFEIYAFLFFEILLCSR